MKIINFIMIICFAILPNSYKIDAMETINKQLAICIENFDELNENQKQDFYNLYCPLTFVVKNVEDYKDIDKADKQFVHFLKINRMTTTIFAQNDISNLKQNIEDSFKNMVMYNSCVVIFDAKVTSIEDIYNFVNSNKFEFSKQNITLKIFGNFC